MKFHKFVNMMCFIFAMK